MIKKDEHVVLLEDTSSRPLLYRVDEVKDGYVYYYPRGGGFRQRIPERVLRLAKVSEGTPPARMGYFGGDWLTDADGDPVYIRGITFDEDWNGWAVPYFTTANGREYLEIYDPTNEGLHYDAEADLFYQTDEEGKRYDEAVIYESGMRFHQVGNGWCWEEFSPTYEAGVKGLRKRLANIPGMFDEIMEYYERLRKV